MIVKVKFKSKFNDKPYGGEYTYKCDIPDIQKGDWVIAPSRYGAKEAMVTATYVPERKVEPRLMAVLQTITRRREG